MRSEAHYPVSSAAAMTTPLIMLAAFGPYLSRAAGLRTDHVAIYFAAPFFLFSLLAQARRIPFDHPVVIVVSLLAVACGWTCVGTALGGYSPATTNLRVSSLENAVQPVLVSMIAFAAAFRFPPDRLREYLDHLLILFIAIMCANTLVAAVSFVVDISPLMRFFTRSNDATWFSAITGARLSGLFSQPAEQGTAVSFAVLAWCYRHLTGRRGFWASPGILLFLLFGGLAGLSKIFLVGGTALLVLFIGPRRLLQLVFRPGSVFVLALLIAGTVLVIPGTWNGIRLLQGWFGASSPTELVSTLSAGRFGAGSEYFVQNAFVSTWQTSPMFGFGFGYSPILDNGYLEYFLQGGIVSLGAYIAILVMLLTYGMLRRHDDPILSRFLILLTVLVIGGDIGVPVVSINRFSPCFWIVLVTILCLLRAARQDSQRNRDRLRKVGDSTV